MLHREIVRKKFVKNIFLGNGNINTPDDGDKKFVSRQLEGVVWDIFLLKDPRRFTVILDGGGADFYAARIVADGLERDLVSLHGLQNGRP